jgi:LPXTG-motif cell wall-anchored protein
MQYIFLDVRVETWIESDNHLGLVIISVVSLLALLGIFIYRKRKSGKNGG